MRLLDDDGVLEATICVWALIALEALALDAAVHLPGLVHIVCLVAFCGMAALQAFLLFLIIASTFRRLLKGPPEHVHTNEK